MYIPIIVVKCLIWIGVVFALLISFIIGWHLGSKSAYKDKDWH